MNNLLISNRFFRKIYACMQICTSLEFSEAMLQVDHTMCLGFVMKKHLLYRQITTVNALFIGYLVNERQCTKIREKIKLNCAKCIDLCDHYVTIKLSSGECFERSIPSSVAASPKWGRRTAINGSQ